MREIKFRVFNEALKKMQNVVSLWHSPNSEIAHVVVALDEEYAEVDTLFRGYQLMQLTGLKDSNGAEIYEGDIIHQLSKPNWHSKVDNKYIVEFGHQDLGDSSYQQTIGWNATDVRYIGKDYTKSKGILDLCLNHPGITAVVIGNIHENPELLK